MKKTTLLLMGVMFLVATGCQKTEELVPGAKATVSETSAIAVVDGRLNFATKELYVQTVKHLVAHQGELLTWEKQFSDYTSMRRAFESITSEQFEQMIEEKAYDKYRGVLSLVQDGDDKELAINIEDHVVATLVSDKGLVQIGTDVYKIGHDKTVKFSHYAPGMENSDYALTDAGKGVTVALINRREYTSPTLRGARGETNRLEEYWVGWSKRRLVATVYDWGSDLFDDAHIGFQTKHQRRFSGIWFAEDIPSLGYSGYGSYQVYSNGIPIGSPVPFSVPSTSTSGSYINQTLAYDLYRHDFIEVHTVHFGNCNDGNYREMRIN